jgi:phospholipid/cholesterol/gamma-HCH transport system permease protein
VQQRLAGSGTLRRLSFDAGALTAWDTGLLVFVTGVQELCHARRIEVDTGGLPDGVRELLRLAAAVPERAGARRGSAADPWLARLGAWAVGVREGAASATAFVGEAVLSVARFCTGRAQLRLSDLALHVQACGAEALPIVSLINLLVGLILAYVGVQQLALFSAQIFTADLVAIAVTREMAAIMTGIIMAGRTGAAFAAQLGTMTVNEEIDALATLGISPFDFLVLPRMLALVVMVPLLSVYGDVMGIAGGALVAIPLGDLTPALYWQKTLDALTLSHVTIGVAKSAVFGVLVALTGCLRGMQSGRSAQAVGEAATSAVVSSIVLIIVFDAVFAVCLATLGI